MSVSGRMGGTKYVFAGTTDERDEVGVKTCPRCGEMLFADMDVCYGCLYDFTKDQARGSAPGEGRLASVLDRRASKAGGMAERPSAFVPPRGDPLADIELDEVDDVPLPARGESAAAPDEPVLANGESAAAKEPMPVRRGSTAASDEPALPSVPPRHSKREVPSADDTLDLAIIDATTVFAPQLEPLVIVVSSDDMQVWLPLPEQGLSVGRDEDNDIVLRSRSVSRHHLRLVPQGAAVLAQDCGATNPATVHGRPLSRAESIGAGETVSVCGATLAIRRYTDVGRTASTSRELRPDALP